MTDEFRADARRWRFLDNPVRYLGKEAGGLEIAPLTRQFKTVKEILSRFGNGHGVLLADDVGLGKTTVGALVAWVLACQDKSVRIYAPNDFLRRRWAEELERHIPMLLGLGYAASDKHIKHGDVGKLHKGRIQVATHHVLIESHKKNELRTTCDLMIIDEAHRAKGEGSAFNEALKKLGSNAKRKLILTATPFSIDIAELKQLLQFVGASNFESVQKYSKELKQLYCLGEGYDVVAVSSQLANAAKAAIEELRPYVIRHGIDDLSKEERKHFGSVSAEPWEIPTPAATQDDLKLLLRMDRILHLLPKKTAKRRNDPRFHVGWQHVDAELKRAVDRSGDDVIALSHISNATKALEERRAEPHPKIAAVVQAIRPLVETGEKVLVFCHHRATANELLVALESSLRLENCSRVDPSEDIWRDAWYSLLLHGGEDTLVNPIVDWLCSSGMRRQIGGWLDRPADTPKSLIQQFSKIRPRNSSANVPNIRDAAQSLTRSLLDTQSTSTRALLRNIAQGQNVFNGERSHFPGRLDDGFRVMGAWDRGDQSEAAQTLYTGKPDIVLALFNSPFGPDVLVATDRLSEGVDLHRCCRHLIHYELDPSPVRTLQRNGRVRRVGSWAALTDQPIRYAYPTFGGTRDEKAVGVMKQRIESFGLLLGGVPSLDDEVSDSGQSFAEQVLRLASAKLKKSNRSLAVV